jgi:hypothetical protein
LSTRFSSASSVPVRQHDDLPVVAHLEQLLRAPVHVPDDRLGGLHPLPVEGQPQPQHAVRGRVLRADVEHHVGGGEVRIGQLLGAGPQADDQLPGRVHPCILPPVPVPAGHLPYRGVRFGRRARAAGRVPSPRRRDRRRFDGDQGAV